MQARASQRCLQLYEVLASWRRLAKFGVDTTVAGGADRPSTTGTRTFVAGLAELVARGPPGAQVQVG